MDFVYGLDDVYAAEEADGHTVLALQAAGEPLRLVPASTLIHIEGVGQPERHLWNVVMALVRYFCTQDQAPVVMGLEGRDGPQGLDLLRELDEILHQRLADESAAHPPIVAIFPAIDGLPEDHASTFQTLVMKSGRANIQVVTTAFEPGLLPMFFSTYIKVSDPSGYAGVLVGKYDQPDQEFNAPHFERQDINRFKKHLC